MNACNPHAHVVEFADGALDTHLETQLLPVARAGAVVSLGTGACASNARMRMVPLIAPRLGGALGPTGRDGSGWSLDTATGARGAPRGMPPCMLRGTFCSDALPCRLSVNRYLVVVSPVEGIGVPPMQLFTWQPELAGVAHPNRSVRADLTSLGQRLMLMMIATCWIHLQQPWQLDVCNHSSTYYRWNNRC